MLRSFEPPRAGEPRLVINGEAFGHPRRHVHVWEERGVSAKNRATESPDAFGSVQMEYVSQLVLNDERAPILVVAQRQIVHWWMSIDDNAIGGERSGVSVCVVHVVRDY